MTGRSFGNKWFIGGAVVLALAAVFMQSAAEATSRALRKRSIPIRRHLRDLDIGALSDFRFIEDMNAGTDVVAGTEEFIEWRFSPTVKQFAGVETISLQAYYYSTEGRPPIIPHTPEVCYRLLGDHVSSINATTIDVDLGDGSGFGVPAKSLRLTQNPKNEPRDCCVLYTFCVNGEFLGDRELARLKIAMPWNRAVYFVKIETVASVPSNGDFQMAFEAARNILAGAIPEMVAKHLPKSADIEAAAARDVSESARAQE
ncbi:MAG: hypothetical protein MI923_09415 [Phycisphaerales bacterium]|nr:hypothetical protein [Phycisphaerales bacterium]